MSVESMALVLHHSRASGTAKLVLIGIANHDSDGGAWPSLATLARYANIDVRNVQRALHYLEELGELKRELQAGGNRQMDHFERPNLYHVLVACPPTCDRSKNHRTLVDNRVAKTSPGDASVTGGVAPVSPGGVAPASPKPSVEPPKELLASVRTELKDARTRARHGGRHGQRRSDPVSDVPGPGDDPGSAAAS